MFRILAFIMMIFAVMADSRLALGSDWSQWLGTDRNGITPENSGYPAGWPPKKLWTKNVGKGCTSPIMVGGKIYVMGWQGEGDLNNNPVGIDTIYCLDAKTATELWKQTYPCRYQGRLRAGDEGAYGGPSSTPTFDSKTSYLYTLSIDEVSLKGATEKWRVRDFSQVGSPIIYNGYIYIVSGSLKCLDINNGQRKWQGGDFEHGSCLITAGDNKVIVFGNGQLVLVEASPSDGQYHELSSVKEIVPDICYPHIALSNGVICCKDKSGNMVCFSVR